MPNSLAVSNKSRMKPAAKNKRKSAAREASSQGGEPPLEGEAEAPKRRGYGGALILGLTVLSVALWLSPGWLIALMTGPSSSVEARWCWAVAALMVSQTVIVLVLLAHYDVRFKERSGVTSPWEDNQTTKDALNLMALFTLWSVCLAMTIVNPAVDVNVLDLVGRAASFGALVGLTLIAFLGTIRYVRAVQLLDGKAQVESFIVLAFLCAVCANPVLDLLALARPIG